MGEVFAWWLIVELLGIAALPLAAVLFARLPDHGWALAKPLGVLVVGWLVWFPLSVLTALPYSRGWIAGVMLVFALGNLALLLRVSEVRAALMGMLARERVYIVLSELVFGGAFALMAWVRSFTPAVVDQEKFMDVGFLSAIWRAPHLPPPDPWLAGYPINYYYFGHFLLATLAKLLGTQPAIAFNIGIALIFALTAVAVFGVATNLLAAMRRSEQDARLGLAPLAGLVSVLMVLILGNLNGAQVAWQNAVALSSGPQATLPNPWAYFTHRELWLDYNWWDPSRVIVKPATINEFPAFSFLLSDLHAHVLALPFAALAIGLALNLVRSRGEGLRVYGSRITALVTLVGSAVVLGALYAINGWDLPTYLGLALLALVIQQWLAHGRRLDSVLLLDLFAAGATLVALVVLLYLPFYRGFVSPSQGVGLVPGYARAPVGLEFAIFGLQVAILGSYLVWQLGRWIGASLEGTFGVPGVRRTPLRAVEYVDGAGGLGTEVPEHDNANAGLKGLKGLKSPAAADQGASVPPRPFAGTLVPRQPIETDAASIRRGVLRTLGGSTPGVLRGDRAPFLFDLSPRTLGMAIVVLSAAILTLLTLATPGFLGWTLLWTLLLILACATLGLRSLGVWELLRAHRAARIADASKTSEMTDGELGDDAGEAWLDGAGEAAGEARLAPTPVIPGPDPGAPLPLATNPRRSAPLPVGEGVGGEVFLLCLFGTAAALVAACELVFLRDVFAGGANGPLGDAFRMNTVFKLYYQAWLIAGVACGPALVLLLRAAWRYVTPLFALLFARTGAPAATAAPRFAAETPLAAESAVVGVSEHGAGFTTTETMAPKTPATARVAGRQAPSTRRADAAKSHSSWVTGASKSPYHRVNALRFAGAGGIVVWMALLALLFAGALVYPVLGSAARTQNFTLPRSLDGTAFMATDAVDAGDADAIAWLNSHITGDEVIVEAAKYDEYTHYGRVSAFTGLPTLLGWGGHELQWRVNWLDEPGHADAISARLDAVNQIYTNPDEASVKQLLRQYSVRLIYVGTAERQVYPTANLDRFAAFLPIVYSREGVTIYAGTGGASA